MAEAERGGAQQVAARRTPAERAGRLVPGGGADGPPAPAPLIKGLGGAQFSLR